MPIRKHTNNYASTLNGAITNVATSLVVTSATGLPSISGSEEYNLTLDNGSGTIEIVTVTAATGTTLTVTRGAESTTAVAWSTLATIELRPTANSLDRKADLVSPTLVTPLLGTPASGVLTNCTGLPVAGGGSGRATATAYAVLCGGTTSTGAHQSIADVGTAAQVLTSNGAGALPTFQTAAGGGMTRTDATVSPVSCVVDTEYTSSFGASLGTFNLPATAALGKVITITGLNSGTWKVVANTGQTIKVVDQTTSAAGALQATSQWDCVSLKCIAANTTWAVFAGSTKGYTIT